MISWSPFEVAVAVVCAIALFDSRAAGSGRGIGALLTAGGVPKCGSGPYVLCGWPLLDVNGDETVGVGVPRSAAVSMP